MTVEEALSQPGERLAAWDLGADREPWLGIFATGTEGARLLASERVPPESRDARHASLVGRVRIGSIGHNSDFVWVTDDAGFAVWSPERLWTSGDHTELLLPDGAVTTDHVRGVVSFVDPEDWGHRGVSLELRDGSVGLVIEEHDPWPSYDPTYGWDHLLMDSFWAYMSGRHLAHWLGVPHCDET